MPDLLEGTAPIQDRGSDFFLDRLGLWRVSSKTSARLCRASDLREDQMAYPDGDPHYDLPKLKPVPLPNKFGPALEDLISGADRLKEKASAEEERMITSETGGKKGTKLARVDLMPPRAVLEVAEHFGRGAAKYTTPDHDGSRNWEKGYNWSLSYAALMRHALAWWDGEDMDPELQSHHMAAVAFHALVLLENRRINPQFDDRPRKA